MAVTYNITTVTTAKWKVDADNEALALDAFRMGDALPVSTHEESCVITKEGCEWCVRLATCRTYSADQTWVCTRALDHAGDHVACWNTDRTYRENRHAVHRWTDEEAYRPCPYCVIDNPSVALCRRNTPSARYICTRAFGHTGTHIACSSVRHVLEEWG